MIKPDVLDFSLVRLEVELSNAAMMVRRLRMDPFERIEAGYHEKIVLPLMEVMAIAENIEAAMINHTT